MRQMVVISGKGGTGKTILTASLAALAKNAVLADCDVDAADLYLLLKPEIREKHLFRSGYTARIDKGLCQECGRCTQVCRFGAISDDLVVDGVSCEGCAVCSHICPAQAIVMEENLSGEWYISDTRYGPMVHARLGIAEENSGKLVTVVKENAKKIAQAQNKDYLIVDGPPGIGCPVIASLANVDLALVVTEPSLSGIHDMERVIEVARHFGVKTKVVINKYDINVDNSKQIGKLCASRGIDILGQLPFSREVSESLIKSRPLVEISKGEVAQAIISLWDRLKQEN